MIVSDDDGRSFHDGGCVPDFIGGSEAQVAELRDGSILLASRLYGDQKHNPPWFETHFVPRFRLHASQRVLGQGFIKHHPADAGSPTLIAGGPHSDSGGTSHGIAISRYTQQN